LRNGFFRNQPDAKAKDLFMPTNADDIRVGSASEEESTSVSFMKGEI